ncbi:MAG: acetyltransferase [Methanoregula sp.]|nr:acetyltransferase [Methanoregula sp.]
MAHVPVVLVHGWKSHPGIWNRLVPRLEHEGIPFWNFDQTPLNGSSVEEIAATLKEQIEEVREERRYFGVVDLVCHSMGTCVARYMLEVLDGTAKKERVRQLIGIGPPNNGSALAELFNHPEYGKEIIRKLSGIFVPENYDPASDLIVQQFRPHSVTMRTLAAAGLRRDIAYRIICAENLTHTPGFFPGFDGKTWEASPAGGWQQTYAGDGIVPHLKWLTGSCGTSIITVLLQVPERQNTVPALPPHLRCITNIMRPRVMMLKIRVEGAVCVGAAVG